jgi:hypothetical protein
MTTAVDPAAASAASSVRPSRARAPSMAWRFADTSAPVNRAEPAEVGIKVIGGVMLSAISDTVLLAFSHSVISGMDMSVRRSSGAPTFAGAARCTIRTNRSESGYGNGSSSTVLTTLKTAVAAPIPRASVTTAAVVKPGLRASPRSAYDASSLRSAIRLSGMLCL